MHSYTAVGVSCDKHVDEQIYNFMACLHDGVFHNKDGAERFAELMRGKPYKITVSTFDDMEELNTWEQLEREARVKLIEEIL